jgi:hypothetical protein
MASGLIRLSPSMPVPCSIEIFSSMVISLTTIAARSSGERLEFDHGWLLLLDWAREVETAKLRMITVRVKNEIRRETPCRGIVAPRLKVAAKSLMLRLF